MLLVVVPSHVFGQVLAQVKPFLRPDTRIAWATKGLEPDSVPSAARRGARGAG